MVVPPSQKELELLKTFRGRIKDVELIEKHQSDLFLVSWLRARDLDLVRAEEMFRASFKWRKENGIDTILNTFKTPEIFDKKLPFQISGVDKDKCPILIIPFGKWDVRKMIEIGERENYVKYNDYMNCKVLELTETAENCFSQFNIIFDLKGYSLRQLTGHGCVDLSLEIVKRFEANFPERLKIGYIINAPKIFSILFALVKPLLSPVTLAKVKIYGSNASKWKLGLLNNIPADQLPIVYGGTSTVPINLGEIGGGEVENSTDANEMIEVTVGAGEKLEVEYEVKHPNTKLSWRYKTDGFDIGFCVKYKNDQEIIKYERVEAGNNEQSGEIICEQIGSYTLVFDNTYSVVRPKTLTYSVTLYSTEESDEEENTDL